MIDDSSAAALVYSPEFAGEIEPAIAAAALRFAYRGQGVFACLAAHAKSAAIRCRAGNRRRWLLLALLVRLHRCSERGSQRFGVETLGIREDDIFYSEAKLFFAYGLGNNLTFPLWVGATAVLNEHRPGPATSFPPIKRFRPTLYFGVPTLYAAYLQHFVREKPDLSSVRSCVSAGEALPAEILRRWHEETGLWILDGIGSTEALHILISNTPADVKPGSSGRVVSGYRARIVDEHGIEVGDDESGQLFISGD